MSYKILCLGGGSVRGLSELGALHLLSEKGYYQYDEVSTFIGTSIGSVICLLLNVGYTPIEIFNETLKINKMMKFDTTDILNFMKEYGLLQIDYFIQIIEKLILKKYNKILTLTELYKDTNKKFISTSVNITKKQLEYISYETFPDLLITDAVKMSCNLPLLFKKVQYNGDLYVDGGVLNNFPIDYLNDGETKILGICIEGNNKPDNTFIEYIYSVLTISVLEIQRLKIDRLTSNCRIFDLDIKDTPPIDFHLQDDIKMRMFCDGYNIAKEYCEYLDF